MRSLWSDADAERMIERYAQQGVGRDLALRVYTSRLLGGEPKLVLHGGGNTSVKTVVQGPPRRGGRGVVRQRERLGHGGDRARRAARRAV